MAARYRQPASKVSTSPTSDFDPAKPIKDVADDTTSTNTTSNPSENFSGKLSGKPTGLTLLDIFRILGGLFLLSCSLSHLSTSGESLTWGYNAWWTRARDWKAWMVCVILLPIPISLSSYYLPPTSPITPHNHNR
jgi:hypothetical protein